MILLPILFGVVVMWILLRWLKRSRELDAKDRASFRHFMITRGYRSPWWL